ncbi:MAG TPA: hypothetical protein VEG62_01920 [Acidimicrobiales bacterium]|nr:hypothetical protein [Acidimicrobiales bacterium]
MSKDVEGRPDRKPMTFGHAVWVTVLGVAAVVIAYWMFRVLAGFFIFLGEIALAVVVVAGLVWLFSRLRH